MLEIGVAGIPSLRLSPVRLSCRIPDLNTRQQVLAVGRKRNAHRPRPIVVCASVQRPVVLCASLHAEQVHNIHISAVYGNKHNHPPVRFCESGICAFPVRLHPLHLFIGSLKGKQPTVRRALVALCILPLFVDHHRIVTQRARTPGPETRVRIAHVGQQLMSPGEQGQVQVVRVFVAIASGEMQVDLHLVLPVAPPQPGVSHARKQRRDRALHQPWNY